MKNTCIVYCHISPINKVYVGITSQKAKDRWRNGKGYKGNMIFNKAIEKYGWDNFVHAILFKNVSREFAIEKEIELIKKWNTTNRNFGYNRDFGGCIHTEETKRKIGDAHIGDKNYWRTHKHTEEYCKAMSEKLKGRVFTDEHKKRLSECQKGEKNHKYGTKWTEEDREARKRSMFGKLNPNYGKKWTDEQKEASSKRMKAQAKLGKDNPNWGRGKKVIQIDNKTGEEIMTFQTLTRAYEHTGVKPCAIGNCCAGRNKTAGGFKWQYAEVTQ